MKSIKNFQEVSRLSTNEMNIIKGGKELIKCEFKSDEQGTYYELTYDDGSVEYIPYAWYA